MSSATLTLPKFKRAPDTISLLAQILAGELNLPPGRIRRFNQRGIRENTEGLQITLAFLTAMPVANNNTARALALDPDNPAETTLVEIETLNTREYIAISLMSVADENGVDEATERWPEVVMALQSTRALQIMEKYSFSIAMLPSPLENVSVVEGPAETTRLDMNISVLRGYERINGIPYLIPSLPPALTYQS